MPRLAVYYKPIVTHLSDETNGRTLCGITIPENWEFSGTVDDAESALCGCVRCQRAADKFAKEESKQCQ